MLSKSYFFPFVQVYLFVFQEYFEGFFYVKSANYF